MSQNALNIGEFEGWLQQKNHQIDWAWTLGLLVAAGLIFTVDLGALPLRDWDEGTVAQVAREIYQASAGALTWLHPTLHGEPYFNKPPLMHGLIAIAYQMGGVSELTSRLPGAILSALSVPVLYHVGREAFYRRTPAGFAALVYLTSLPVVRHGRLAMLDGAIVCFFLLMLWCMLRSRRDVRFALGIGMSLGLICLTKGVMLGALLGAIALLFLLWDTPRLLSQPYLWLGLLLGCGPVVAWYGAQWVYYGSEFWGNNLVDQSLQRVWEEVENHAQPTWYYLLELLKYGVPWIIFLPLGLRLSWKNRNLSWAKLVLVWSGVYFIAISVMVTKLPWYVMPLYPAIALIVGAQLTLLWEQGRHAGMKQFNIVPYSYSWVGIFSIIALVALAGSVYFGFFSPQPQPNLQIIMVCVCITMTMSAILITQQDPHFLSILIWGTYVSLFLLMLSNHWVWELAESYPVKPVAAILQTTTPEGATIFTSYPHNRPSLDFYSDRQVLSVSRQRLRRQWRQPHPYLLLDEDALKMPALQPQKILGFTDELTLVTRSDE